MNAGQRILLRVAVSIFAGSFLGGLIGSQLQCVSLLWSASVGCVCGGLFATVFFTFEDIRLWAPVAWKRASGWHMPEKKWFSELCKSAGLVFGAIASMAASLALLYGLLCLVFPENGENASAEINKAGCLCILYMIWILYMQIKKGRDLSARETIKYGNPVAVFIVFPIWWTKTILWFLWYLGKLIYSDALVLVVLHAVLGGAVGAHIGGLWSVLGISAACAVSGAVQYEVLSKRVFKLVTV